MLFDNVGVLGLEHVDAPHVISSAQIEDRLGATFARLGYPTDVLRRIAGVEQRRWWDPGVQPSEAATLAAERVLSRAEVPRDRVGAILNTSVCRDFLEPSTACGVHHRLGLGAGCLNFDLGNACLAFLNGMEVAGLMLERGAIDYALVVDAESSRHIQERTLERMTAPGYEAAAMRREFATLTLGSGAVAMLLTRRDLHPESHTFRGGLFRAATEHAGLCFGEPERMETDAQGLLRAGVGLAERTWREARDLLGWHPDELDELVMHQVSKVHTATLCHTLGLPVSKALLTFPTLGNMGPASLPITLSKAVAAGRVRPGDRVALMGIGSGLNCAMFEVIW